jgi:molybdopterin molybdotransferase
LLARPAHARGSASHLVSALVGATGIAMVPEGVTEVREGDVLTVRLLG